MPFTIRLAREDDGAAVATIYRPIVESTPISFETELVTPSEMSGRIAETLTAYPWLVCECDARVIGYAYATKHRVRAAYRWSVDASVYIDAEFRGRRVGQALYTSLNKILVAQGFFNAYAGITLPNAASVALHESMGYRPVGNYRHVGYKLGEWYDVGWWHLELQPLIDTPEEPVPVTDLQRDPSWISLVTAGESIVGGSQGKAVL